MTAASLGSFLAKKRSVNPETPVSIDCPLCGENQWISLDFAETPSHGPMTSFCLEGHRFDFMFQRGRIVYLAASAGKETAGHGRGAGKRYARNLERKSMTAADV